MTYRLGIFVVGLTLVSPGCANVSDETQTTAGGIGLGATLGGVLGAVLGGERGAIIGASIGGVLGGVGGHVLARTKADYASREDMIEKETNILQARINETEEMNQTLKVELASLNQEIERLDRERSRGQTVGRETTEAKARASGALKQAEEQLAELNAELDTTSKLLAEAKTLSGS